MVLKALLWDVDGTLAETERDGHLVAFNASFAELDVPWRWSVERYAQLLRTAGGFERLLYDFQSQPLAPKDAAARRDLAARIHLRKNQIYPERIASGAVTLRPGVRELMDDCAAEGMRMAVVTTTSRGNLTALLDAQLGSDWVQRFAAIVCAEDAPLKKPDPQAYRLVLERLALPGSATVAIEDSPAGLESARAAGIPVVITRSEFFADDPVPNALAVGPGLGVVAGWNPKVASDAGRINLQVIRSWHDAA